MQLRRALVASGGLALAAAPAACSGDDGTGGLEFSEAPVDVGEYDYVNGVVAWDVAEALPAAIEAASRGTGS